MHIVTKYNCASINNTAQGPLQLLCNSALALLLCHVPGIANANGPLLGNPVDAVPAVNRPATSVAPLQSTPPPVDTRTQQKLAQRITVKHFDVKGSRSIPFADITGILKPLAGKTLTLAELIQRVNGITTLYQQHGYPLSFALLQDQSFEGGLVQITVVEGHVDAVTLEGNPGRSAVRLQRLAQPLLDEKPLTRTTLERTLNLMRTVPGVRITPTLNLPQHENGATTLSLDVQHQPAGLTATAADMGTGMQGLVELTANSLTPLGEKIKVTAAIPTQRKDVHYIAGSLELPLGANGLALTIDGFHYRSQPENDALGYLGWERKLTNERIGADLSYPFVLSNTHLLKGSIGMYAARTRDEHLRTTDNAWLAEDAELRVAHAQLQYRDTSPEQSREATLSIHKGIDGLGARKAFHSNYGLTTQPEYDLGFTRASASLKQTLSLPASLGMVLSATGQYSNDILPSTEQISFGSWRYALGYPQGDQAGDKGYGVSIELNRRFNTGNIYVKTLQPYIVMDHTQAWYNAKRLKSYNGRKLSSIGVGLRATDDKHYVFDINVARPTGASPNNKKGRDVRINTNFSLLYNGF